MDLADAYLDALASPQMGELAPHLDASSGGSFAGSGGVIGRAQVVGLHQLLFGAFDARRFVATRVLRTPRCESIEWIMSGVHARDWMGVTATHGTAAFNGITLLWTRDDSTISDVHVYFDVEVVKAQLGAGPRELRARRPPRPVAGRQRLLRQRGTSVEIGNVVAVRAELDALQGHDESAYASSMTEDVEIFTPEREAPLRGSHAARMDYEAVDHSIGQLETSVHSAWGVSNFAVAEYSITGVQRAALEWVPLLPARVVELHVVGVFEVRDSKIARIWRYDNVADLAAVGP